MIYIAIPSTKERRNRLEKCIEAIKLNTKYPVAICTYENEERCKDIGWVKAVHKLLEGINGLVFILGDDAIIEPNCIEKLYEEYIKLPNKEEWLLQPYEQINKGELATFPFAHSDILKTYISKEYNHNFSDTELTEVMKKKGRYLPVLEAKVYHEHFTVGAKLDETYKKTTDLLEKDRLTFQRRCGQ